MKERKNRAKKIRGVKKVMNPLLKFNYILNYLSISFGLDFAAISNCCYVSYVQTKASDAAKGKKKWGYQDCVPFRQ